MAKDYGESSIKTLDPVTHIRMRPGMYVGEPGTGAMYHDCIYILMKEVIDNAIDEFGQGYGKKIDVTVNYDTGEVSVRDYGRGMNWVRGISMSLPSCGISMIKVFRLVWNWTANRSGRSRSGGCIFLEIRWEPLGCWERCAVSSVGSFRPGYWRGGH